QHDRRQIDDRRDLRRDRRRQGDPREGSRASSECRVVAPAERCSMMSDVTQSRDASGAPSQRGTLMIVSSPSGAGKTTLTRRLLEEFSGQLAFSVSYTTRPQRTGEVEGRDYHFVTPEQFQRMVERGEFAEHAFVFGNRYGTAQAPVEAALGCGTDVIFDVD